MTDILSELSANLSPVEKEAEELLRNGFEAGIEEIKKRNVETKWFEHCVPPKVLMEQLNTSLERGLTSEQARKVLERDGENKLSPPKEKPEWRKFLEQMTGMFSLLLWFGGALSFFGYILDPSGVENLYIGIVLFVVVFLTGVFSYFQEKKSSDIMKQFKGMLPEKTKVIRDGRPTEIDATLLVVGDIVEVGAGEKCPGDLRVVQSSGLKVDHSALTGEPDHLLRGTHGTHFDPKESGNICFFGAALHGGTALAVVVKTGDRTEMGRIKTLASSGQEEESPISIELHHFIKIVSSVAGFLGISFFIVGIVNKRDWISNLVFMIGIIVANVPEGLLATVTVSLSLTAQRMFKENVMVRKLEAVETLGSTSCICSDKTGTLTQNIMTVVDICIDNEIKNCGISTDAATGQKEYNEATDPTFQPFLRSVCLASAAKFSEDPGSPATKDTPEVPANMSKDVQQRAMVGGNASDHALVKFGERSLLLQDPSRSSMEQNIVKVREQHREMVAIPFNSSNKWELHVYQLPNDKEHSHVVAIKGATDRLLNWCSHIMINGRPEKLNDERRMRLAEKLTVCMNKGERIIGFAQSLLPARSKGVVRNIANGKITGKFHKTFEQFGESDFFDQSDPGTVAGPFNARFPTDDFCFLGFCGLQDPPRVGVKEAVESCHTAGIKVIMVTGDHPGTARAIAQQVGIVDAGQTAEELASAALGKDETKLTKEEVKAHRRFARARVIPGSEVAEIVENKDDAEWDAIMSKKQLVFARTSPEQKLVIVDQCQKRGMIVAVTGDGVNDSPALKKAHIGVAMGITGTPVAKDVADMILMDDSFASIVMGVKEGRLIFDNLKKSIAYTLSSNIPEISPFLAFITFGMPLPLSTVLILCVDLGTDMLPAISLAYERPENDIMLRQPRSKQDNLVTSRLISFSYLQVGCLQALAGFFTYLVVLGDYGFPPWILPNLGLDWTLGNNLLIVGQGWIARDEALRRAQTAFFVTIVIVQWADLLICKTRTLSLFYHGFHNRVLVFGLFEETVLCFLLCYIPPINIVFGTRPIRFLHWLPPMPFSLTIFCYDETRKWIMRRSPTGFIHDKTYY